MAFFVPSWALGAAAAVLVLSADTFVAASVLVARPAGTQHGCANLKNEGTYFTVDVDVGAPSQKFSLVVDTGSDHLIVESCLCQEQGLCPKTDRCFRGTNHSSTFSVRDIHNQGPPGMAITFGSGTVGVLIASDQATVGSVTANMSDGLLLMYNRQLNFDDSIRFEGILGLGIPQEEAVLSLPPVQKAPGGGAPGAGGGADDLSDIIDALKKMGIDTSGAGANKAETMPMSLAKARSRRQRGRARGLRGSLLQTKGSLDWWPFGSSREDAAAEAKGAVKSEREEVAVPLMDGEETIKEPRSFLEYAGVERFSLCFGEQEGGRLELGAPELEKPLGSIGTAHWGLDFQGISIGETTAEVKFCGEGSLAPGQETACGIIPDSGTTLMLGPKDQIALLHDDLCDKWERCRNNHTALLRAAELAGKAATEAYGFDPFGLEESVKGTAELSTKALVLKLLLSDCNSWLTNETGVNELPELHLKVAGAGGESDLISLPGWAYVMETLVEEVEYEYKEVPGVGQMPVGVNKTGRVSKQCQLAVDSMDYQTEKNGAVWILGTPLFYQYEVAYDTKMTPPSMAFTSLKGTTCGTCQGASGKDPLGLLTSAVPRPRYMEGPPRRSSIDTRRPL